MSTVSYETFDSWVGEMDDEIKRLMPVLPEAVRGQMDFSSDSLLVLGEWLVSQFSTLEELKSAPERLYFRLTRYVGETFLEEIDGFWFIDLEDKRSVFYKMPVVRDEGQFSVSPLSLLGATVDRRDPTFIHGYLQRLIRRLESPAE